jgi:Mn2+/Fe2+ NRAMP family transporter
MVMMMRVGSNMDVMGQFTLSTPLRIVGWLATAAMAAAAVGMIATW